MHTKDADCQGHLDANGVCKCCGVYYAGACPWCGGHAYHIDDQCPNLFEYSTPEYTQARANWELVEAALRIERMGFSPTDAARILAFADQTMDVELTHMLAEREGAHAR